MRRISILLTVTIIAGLASCTQNGKLKETLASPGELRVNDGHISLIYNNKEIVSLDINANPSSFVVNDLIDDQDGKINHAFTITSKDYKALDIEGVINAGVESFACEADRRIEGTQVVRHVYGPSSNLLNRAVYDRDGDWLISADRSYTSSNYRIIPQANDSISKLYAISMKGNQLTLRFRPHYYQKHRGLKYFDPSSYKVWNKSVAGWCSWFAYKTEITEQNIKETCDVISETMLPYGLDYLQIDDGYQQNGGQPEKWINPNEKFPSGLPALAAYIKSKGLKPGIWTNVAIHDSAYAAGHKEWFVTDAAGNLSSGRWVDYIIDGTNKEALTKQQLGKIKKWGAPGYILDENGFLVYRPGTRISFF